MWLQRTKKSENVKIKFHIEEQHGFNLSMHPNAK